MKLAAGKAPGATIELRVLRQGKLRAGRVKLGAMPGQPKAAAIPAEPDPVAGATFAKPEPAPGGSTAADTAAATVQEPPRLTQGAPAEQGASAPAASSVAEQDKLPASVVPQIGHTSAVSALAFSSDGKFALSGSNDGTMKLWDVAAGKEMRTFIGDGKGVEAVAFSPDGRFAVSAPSSLTAGSAAPPLSPGEPALWDLATGKQLRRFTGHTGAVNSIAISADGRFLVSGGDEHLLGEMKIWDLATGKELENLQSNHSTSYRGVTAVNLSTDSRYALIASEYGMWVWELSTGRLLLSFEGIVDCAAFSPDGHFVLSGGVHLEEGELRLWDTRTGQELRRLSGHTSAVTTAAFSPGGQFAFSATHDTIKVWDVASGKELRNFGGEPFSRAAFSPDGRYALTGGNSGLRLWELSSGRLLRGFGGTPAVITSAAVSPDGQSFLLRRRQLDDEASRYRNRQIITYLPRPSGYCSSGGILTR